MLPGHLASLTQVIGKLNNTDREIYRGCGCKSFFQKQLPQSLSACDDLVELFFLMRNGRKLLATSKKEGLQPINNVAVFQVVGGNKGINGNVYNLSPEFQTA